MSRPRVLLVEDDASIRRFVALALEDTEVDLVEAESVAEARHHLAGAPFELVITDLMLPGETGLDLLRHMARHPAPPPGSRVAVFSAGLNADTQAQLAPFGVWRLLSKPIALAELERCVRDAIEHAPAAGEVDPGPQAPLTPADLSPGERAAVARHFAGNGELFVAYRASCLDQFASDCRQGDGALAPLDLASLRRLAHSLKSVLLTLGHGDLSETARQLEDAAALGHDAAHVARLWEHLRTGLAALRSQRPRA